MTGDDTALVECRICQSCSSANLIQSPCLCKGSLGRVHIRCLEDWLSASSKNSCELCSFKFELVRVRRYNWRESVRIWISTNRKIVYKGFVLVTATCAILSTLFFLWIRWIANVADIIREEREAKERADEHGGAADVAVESGRKSFWLEGTVFFLYLVLMVALRIVCEETYALVRTQCAEWRRWRSQTWKVRLVLNSQQAKMIGKVDDVFVEVDLSETVIPESRKSSVASFHKEELNLQSELLTAVHKPTACNVENL